MYELLRYIDETDKSMVVAGMAIALLACDGENYIASVSVEEGEETLQFTPEIFFDRNTRISAKLAWQQIINEFHIFSGVLLGNILCRYIVADKQLDKELIDVMHRLIEEYGRQDCELDGDEIELLFDKDLCYFHRLFNHPTVIHVAKEFAHNLRLHRRMTRGDVLENLNRLSGL